MGHFNEEQVHYMENILREYKDCFHLPGDKFKATTFTHTISTTNEVPIYVKQYRYPSPHKDEIDKQVNKLLKDKIITPWMSPYNAPLWIVPN